MFVENKQGVLFNFFSLLFNVVRRKCAFKASEGCFSVYYANTLIIVYYVTFFNTKNACSKQAGAAFQSIKVFFVIRKIQV